MLSDFPASNALKRKRKKLTGKEIFQKAFSLFGAIAFLSMAGSGLIKLYSNGLQSERAQDETTASDQMSELAAREKGYELVLEREPNNPVALQGLLQTRIQMQNLEQALIPLEKLIQLNPEKQELKILRDQIKADSQ